MHNVPNMTTFQNIQKTVEKYSYVYKKRNERWTTHKGAKTFVSLASQLPLAFLVCSVRLSEIESRPCWSREQARQSTALRVCSAPAPRATEDTRKTTVTTTTAKSNCAGGPSHTTPTSCFSMRVCSSIRVSISVMLVSSTIPPMTSSDRMKWTWAHQMIGYCLSSAVIPFSAFKVHCTHLLQWQRYLPSCAGYSKNSIIAITLSLELYTTVNISLLENHHNRL